MYLNISLVQVFCSSSSRQNYVESSSGQALVLNFGGGTRSSTTSTFQDNPLAPLLFSTTAQPLLKQVDEVDNVVQNTWF